MKPLRYLLLVSALFIPPSFVRADGTIIQMSRKLRMTENESMPPKDFFIDLGQAHGVKIGDIFEVYRNLSVLNGLVGDAASPIRVTLGQIKVYQVGESASVGRAVAQSNPRDLPAMDNPWFITGDSVAPKTSLPIQPLVP